MHEFNVCQSIIDAIKKYVPENGQNVKRVIVVIGALRPIVSEYLMFTFDYLIKGTIAEGSELLIKRPQDQGKCLRCGSLTEVTEKSFHCRVCGEERGEIFGGRELYIEYIELYK